MAGMNIVDARVNGKKDGPITVQGLGKVRAGKKSFTHDNGLMIERAYNRISEISGVPLKAVAPLTLVMNRREIAREMMEGGTGPSIISIMDAINRNTLETEGALPDDFSRGIDAAIRHRRDNALASLGVYCMNPDLDSAAAYLMQNPFHAVFVFMPSGTGKQAAVDVLQILVDGHFKALDALLNPGFLELEAGGRGHMLRRAVCAVLESDPELRSLENALARAARLGNANAEVILDTRQLHMINAFIHENGEDNLVLLMSFLDELAKLNVDEFRTPENGGAQHAKAVWESLMENGLYDQRGMTLHAKDYVRSSVHGFFRKR